MKFLALLVLVGMLIIVATSLQPLPRSSAPHAQAPILSVYPASTVPASSSNTAYYRLVAEQAAQVAGILVWVFVRQINQESGFQPRAISPAGAEGIAQFMPATAKALRVDPWDPVASLYVAARLMASYVALYQGDYARALAAYNAGSGTVAYAVARGGSASWRGFLPQETQRYIVAILGGGSDA